MIYSYNTEIKAYTEAIIYSKEDIVKSNFFVDLSIKLENIFE